MNELNHVAIIMDGNGRWAKEKGLPRTAGHKKGVEKVREIAIHANQLGIKCLTVYAFSTENWKRPLKEVEYLMSLPSIFFKAYLKELMEKNIKVRLTGTYNKVPLKTKEVLQKAIKETSKNTGMILNFCFNYGGRDEIVKACNKFAKDYAKGNTKLLNEESFKNYLMTSDLPDVDLLIRTSKELRISNFLLYELAYSEMIFLDVYWPNFSTKDFDNCVKEYYGRSRRFGGVNETKNN